MIRSEISDSISQLEIPRTIKLQNNLFACCFQLMKLLPARFMIDRAEDRGELNEGGLICESTSGTFGLALAILGSVRGYKVKLISDPVIDDYLAARLKSLDAEVEIIEKPNGAYGYQKARLNRLYEVLKENPDAYWPKQYDNPDNPLSYSLVAEQLATNVGKVDCLVGTVGSGGSMSGTASFLREVFPSLLVYGVDTHGSVLFGQADGTRTLRGLGNSIIPQNLDYQQFDEVHWVTAAEALSAMYRLHRNFGLFMGPTSGAAMLVANWVSQKFPDKTIVVLLPDEGHRYYQTAYSEQWQSAILGQSLAKSKHKAITEPITVSSPQQARDQWCRYMWRRQSKSHLLLLNKGHAS